MTSFTSMVRPTRSTKLAFLLIASIILASAAYLLVQYPSLPELLPVRFGRGGGPTGWQFKTYPRVLMPVFVQLALGTALTAIGALLLSRRSGDHDVSAPDVRAAQTAAEAVLLMALIWVAFQGYAAFALVGMWTIERAGLGSWYLTFQLCGI